MERYAPFAAFGRLLIAILFIISGLEKLADPVATQSSIAAAGLPFPSVAYAVAVGIEIFGGILLIAGYRTRLVAGVLALFSIATAIALHRVHGDMNQNFHFLKNVAIAGGLLQLVAFGAGQVSVDASLSGADLDTEVRPRADDAAQSPNPALRSHSST